MRRILLLATPALVFAFLARPVAQVRLIDETDRAAFRGWFTTLADAQFYRHTADVTDCAGLVRHAAREALRRHTPGWLREVALPLTPALPDVRHPPTPGANGWPIFHVGGGRYAEFADARTIIRFNTRSLGRDAVAARPGDLLFFVQRDQALPDHLMVFVGRSIFDPGADDWIVYHTGPQPGGAGEVRKVRLADLARHPSLRWRPLPANPRFAGVFRLALP
jgi:hypothetical protein